MRRVEAAPFELTGTQRRQDRVDVGARSLLEFLQDLGNARLDARGDVEDARRARRRLERGGDVVHMNVVARRSSVPEHNRLLALSELVREDRHDAGLSMRALSRAVDIAEATD